MKSKHLLLMLLLAFAAPWAANAQTALPWSENFEGYTSTTLGSEWATPAMYDGKPCVLTNNGWASPAGQNSLECRTNSSNPIVFVFPQFDKNLNWLNVQFKIGGHANGRGEFGYVTNANDASTFTKLTDISQPAGVGNSPGYSSYNYDLSTMNAPANSSYRLAVRYTFVGDGGDSWYFDDFNVTYTEPSGGDSGEGLTVYDGTATSRIVPMYVYYFDDFTRSQFVIPAADLTDMAGGTINSIKFYTKSDNIPYKTVADFDIYVKEVNYTTINALEAKSSATIVYQGKGNFVTEGSGGSITITFSTPFTYNGGNLLIGCDNTTDTGYQSIYFYGQEVTGASTGASNGSGLDQVGFSQQNFIPKTTFFYTKYITEIATVDDWNEFCANVNNGHSYSGETVTLMNDISGVTTMANHEKNFEGTFDGNNHTIEVNYTSTDKRCAPFPTVVNATFKDLTITGTISTSHTETGGFVGYVGGDNGCSFTNCVSDVDITSSCTGSISQGGFVGQMDRGANPTATFTGCAFTGSFSGSERWGGFVGWNEGYAEWGNGNHSTVTFTNCVFAPRSITNVDASDCATFARSTDSHTSYVTITNCYYTQALGTAQGKQAYSITATSPVIVAMSGDPMQYDESGINVYNSGITFTNNNITTIYAGSGETVALTLDGANSYVADHGTLTGSGSSYSLTMAASNTVISVGTVTLTASANPAAGGTISDGTNTISGPTDYAYGTVVTLTATPATGYSFQYWTIDGNTVSGASTTITMDQDHTVVANFLAYETFEKEITGHGGNAGRWYLITSPLNTAIAPTEVTNMIPTTAADYDLFYFDQDPTDNKEWITYKAGEGATDAGFSLEAGKGYLYANKDNVTLKFTGVPYQGDGEIPLTIEGTNRWAGWNLVGNPFGQEAYLDYYYYRMKDDGTELISVQGIGTSTINRMEGVFVYTDNLVERPAVTFTPNASSKTANLALNITQGNSLVDRAGISFEKEGSLPKFQLNPNHTKVYIPMEGKDYAAVKAESSMGEMPVSFKAEKNGSYTFSVNAEEVSFSYLHLIDNQTGADIDLLANPSYSFDARTTDYESRFRLQFATSDSTDGNTFGFVNGAGNLVIFGMDPSTGSGTSTLQMMDLNGRILSSEQFSGNYEKRLNVAPGIYMLRLINGTDVKVQKIVVR